MKTANYFFVMLLFVLSFTNQSKIRKNKQTVQQICLTTADCSGCGSTSTLRTNFNLGKYGYECNFVITKPNTRMCCSPKQIVALADNFNYLEKINFELQGSDGIGIKKIEYSPYSITRFYLVSTPSKTIKTDLIKSGVGLWFDRENTGNCPSAGVKLTGDVECYAVYN